MRVECESCRALVVASIAIAGDTVRATCPACHHVMITPDHRVDPPVDAEQCPKCGAIRRGEAACASCGLAAAHMAAYTTSSDATVPGLVRDAWTRATEGWNDDVRHDELLRVVVAHRCYAWAAGRYRTRGRDVVAQRQLERLRRAAEATLFASATARPDAAAKPYRATRGVLAILIVAVVVGLAYAMVVRNRRPLARATPIPAQPLTPGRPIGSSTVK